MFSDAIDRIAILARHAAMALAAMVLAIMALAAAALADMATAIPRSPTTAPARPIHRLAIPTPMAADQAVMDPMVTATTAATATALCRVAWAANISVRKARRPLAWHIRTTRTAARAISSIRTRRALARDSASNLFVTFNPKKRAPAVAGAFSCASTERPSDGRFDAARLCCGL